jgi:hypothetical protein
MTQQIINIGTPDKGNGDPLRVAFAKVNGNFDELYALLSVASLTELAQDYAAAMFTNGTHVGITVEYDDAGNVINLTALGQTSSGTTPPVDPAEGALWYDSTDGRLYVYYDSFWIDASPENFYTLPTASGSILGGIKVGANLSIDVNGVLSAGNSYVLPAATDTVLGGVKVGSNLTIVDGVLNAEAGDYVLPTASTTVLGGVKVDGSSITIVDGVISAPDANLLGDFSINNTTVSTTTNNVPITFETHNGATVYTWIFGNSGLTTLPDGLALPVSTLTESVETIEVIVDDLVLDATVDYSTGEGDNIPQNTYGIHNQINHPWAVYRFTTTPAPILEIEDILAGDAIPIGSTVLVIGTGGSSDIVVTDHTILGTVPVNGTVISIARPVTNAALAISTNANTDIALIAGAGGRIVTSSSIIPVTTGIYELGTPTRRFGRLWLGGGSIYIEDEVTGADLRITAINGDLVVAGGAGLEVGEFVLRDQTIYLTDPAKEIFIGTTGATAPITFNRTIRVRNLDDSYDLLDVDQQGRMTVLSDIATDPTQAAVSIVGARARDVQSPANLGVLLQLTGSSTAPSRIYHDSYGAANYSAFIGRHARGNSTTPTQTLGGDIISRIGANPHDNVSFASISTMRMDFVNAEDQTTSARGGKIEFWTTPIGSTTIGKRVTIDGSDIVLTALGNGGITFADSTRQTTAWTGSVAAGNVTGLSLVATTNNYSDLTGLPTLFSGVYADLTGKPNVVTSVAVTSGLTVGRVNGAVTLGNSGVLSVAATAGTGQIGVTTVGGAVTLTMPQGLGTTSNVTFNDLTINGTLTVSDINIETAPTVAGKILYLAADAADDTDIDGGGIILGPTDSTVNFRSFLYNLEFDRWDTNGAGLITQELNSMTIAVLGRAYFGNAYADIDFNNALVQIDGNVDDYIQAVIKNHSDGIDASADFVAMNDIGDDTNYYIDLGINSSNYANAAYSMSGANDGYLYIVGGDLAIGTQTATKVVKFFTGDTVAANLRATISDTGLVVVGTTSSTSFSGPLTGDVTGNVSGNAGTVTNGVYTTDTGTVTNLMLAGSIANNKLTNSKVTVNGVEISLGASGTVTAAASTLTGTTLASNVLASSLTSVGTLTNLTVTNPISGSVSGNAGTVTNGVYTTGSYSNPSWITSLAYSKLSGAPTVPTAVSQLTNDSGYITSSALTGYATQVYVNSQGFITTSSLSVTSNTPTGTTSTLSYTGGVFTFTSASAYALPTASTTVLGGVKVDGTTITINGSGVISAASSGGTVTSVSGTGTVSGITLSGTVTSTGNLTLGGALTLTSGQVTTALGYTPGIGTVTNVSALTLGTSGTDVSSTVANSTSTPVITLNIPTASAANRGALSAADWSTFNNKTSNLGTVTSVSGTGTVSGLTLSGTVTSTGSLTLGGTLSLSSGQVTGALGYTPYDAANPAGYTSNLGTVTSVSGTGTVSGLTLTGSVTTSGSLTLGGTLNAVTSLAGGTNIVLSGSTGAVTIQRVDGCQTVVTANSAATYNVTTTDQYVGTTRSATGTGTITLPLGSTVSVGRQYIIKDEGGQSGNVFRRITVAASGSDTIDGSATRSITSNYGALTVLWTGTRWSVI